ncbi:cupin domain-containing protein [Halovivax cerinus]|uniref:Cupin domain-containing protein n=1 Tax=Halovivax cerinus TaxID=1487865 RepID=A0ABD5NTT4_9EURY|nr:cupin domain-containing protein [Halovivax cerinus]
MAPTSVNYADVEPTAGALHFLRDELDCDRLGFTVLECEPGWEGMEHDHADDDHEEIYYLVEGSATVDVDGEELSMDPGDAVHLGPEETRQIRNDDEPSTFVLAGAP